MYRLPHRLDTLAACSVWLHQLIINVFFLLSTFSIASWWRHESANEWIWINCCYRQTFMYLSFHENSISLAHWAAENTGTNLLTMRGHVNTCIDSLVYYSKNIYVSLVHWHAEVVWFQLPGVFGYSPVTCVLNSQVVHSTNNPVSIKQVMISLKILFVYMTLYTSLSA